MLLKTALHWTFIFVDQLNNDIHENWYSTNTTVLMKPQKLKWTGTSWPDSKSKDLIWNLTCIIHPKINIKQSKIKKNPYNNDVQKKNIEFKWHINKYILHPVSIIANHGQHVWYFQLCELRTVAWDHALVFSYSRVVFTLTIPTPWTELRPRSCNSSTVKR